MKNSIFVAVGIIVLVGAGLWYANKMQSDKDVAAVPESTEPVKKVIEVSVADRTLAPGIVTVTEGDDITIRVTTDESGEFHISGYEIENDMEVGSVLEFSFVADKPGRYNFELHPKSDTASESHDEEDGEEASETADEATEAEHDEAEEDIVIGAFVVNPK